MLLLLFYVFLYFFYSDLKRLAPKNSTAKIELLGDYDPEGPCIIRDPYYVSAILYIWMFVYFVAFCHMF